MNTNKKFYQKNWFIYLCMFFFPLIGVILMWLFNKKSSVKFKGIVSAVAAVWFILLLNSTPSVPAENEQIVSNEVSSETENTISIETSAIVESTSVETSAIVESTSIESEPISEPTETLSEPVSDVPQTEENILLNCDLTVRDVMNGFGDTVLGECAFIRITDEQLKEITSEHLKKFADNVIADSNYNWVSIITNSDTGLFFSGSDISYAVYGKLDKDGSLLDTYGVCILDSNENYIYIESEQESAPESDSESLAGNDSNSAAAPSEQDSGVSNNTEASSAASNNFNTYDNADQQNTTDQYVLNTSTKKIHIPSCGSVPTISPKNYETSNQSIEELELYGYDRCGRCLK